MLPLKKLPAFQDYQSNEQMNTNNITGIGNQAKLSSSLMVFPSSSQTSGYTYWPKRSPYGGGFQRKKLKSWEVSKTFLSLLNLCWEIFRKQFLLLLTCISFLLPQSPYDKGSMDPEVECRELARTNEFELNSDCPWHNHQKILTKVEKGKDFSLYLNKIHYFEYYFP